MSFGACARARVVFSFNFFDFVYFGAPSVCAWVFRVFVRVPMMKLSVYVCSLCVNMCIEYLCACM